MLKKQIARYGKSVFDVLDIKSAYFESNDEQLAIARDIGRRYKEMPHRTHCKVCNSPLDTDCDFESHEIKYYMCHDCSHLNGSHQDTAEFTQELYTDKQYASSYDVASKSDYENRIDAIYAPKAQFLLNALKKAGEDYKSMHYTDFGAGSGYMVYALNRYVPNAHGFESNPYAVSFANSMGKSDAVRIMEVHDINRTIATTKTDVALFIGVLEHLETLHGTLSSIKNNKHIKYLFFSVPLFSFTVLLESIFPAVFNRHLGAGHTHLFTHKSLQLLSDTYGFQPIASWEFGADSMDLFRSILITIKKNGGSTRFYEYAADIFRHVCDDFQLSLDKGGFASETHMLVKINR